MHHYGSLASTFVAAVAGGCSLIEYFAECYLHCFGCVDSAGPSAGQPGSRWRWWLLYCIAAAVGRGDIVALDLLSISDAEYADGSGVGDCC